MNTVATASQAQLDCEVVLTDIGVPAMLDRVSGELMHPVIGPQAEAQGLYLEPSRLAERLAAAETAPLVLFDVGLGAGSNAVAAYRLSESRAAGRPLQLISFDRSLNAFELARSAAHASAFGLADELEVAARALVTERHHLAKRTHWSLHLGELPAVLEASAPALADVVFWDPFSPRSNPELWTLSAFSALRRQCAAHATVHTYSGATATRSALLLAGFAVGTGVQSGTSRETTIAAVDYRDLSHPLGRRWLERVARSSAPFPSDAPRHALEQIEALPQFQLAP